MKHYLSGEICHIATFETFDKDAIRNAIISHLNANSGDIVEHSKDWGTAKDKTNFPQSVNFYEVNPKNGKPSLIIQKENKTFYKSLI